MAIKITEQRKGLGLSQAELAKRLGMSRPTLIKIEKGLRKLTPTEKSNLATIFSSLEEHQLKEHHNDAVRINIPQKNLEKFKQVLLYVLEKVGAKPNVGMTVLYKLLYFIDFDFYEKHEKQLMGLTYMKNTHGPTPREFKSVIAQMKKKGELVEVKSRYFAHEQKKFLPNSAPDLSLLNGEELEMIEAVLRRYADQSASCLSEMTHRDTPWKATEDGKNIDYELAFYRTEEFSVRDYGEL